MKWFNSFQLRFSLLKLFFAQFAWFFIFKAFDVFKAFQLLSNTKILNFFSARENTEIPNNVFHGILFAFALIYILSGIVMCKSHV